MNKMPLLSLAIFYNNLTKTRPWLPARVATEPHQNHSKPSTHTDWTLEPNVHHQFFLGKQLSTRQHPIRQIYCHTKCEQMAHTVEHHLISHTAEAGPCGTFLSVAHVHLGNSFFIQIQQQSPASCSRWHRHLSGWSLKKKIQKRRHNPWMKTQVFRRQ